MFVQQYEPTCIVLSETWLTTSVPNSIINLTGYSLYRGDREGNRRGGGVCIFLKRAFFKNYKITHINKGIDGIESVWLQLVSSSFNFTLVGIYRPPNCSSVADQQIINNLEEASTFYNNLVVIGDFNFPTVDWTNLTSSRNMDSASLFTNMILNSSLSQLITEPTRYRQNNNPSLLDLILTNDEDLIANIDMLPPIGCSDHVAFICKIQAFTYENSRNSTTTYRKIDYNRLLLHFLEQNWEHVYETSDIDQKWNFFQETIKKSVNLHTTVHHKIVNSKKPYITEDIIHNSKTKRRFWRKYKSSGSNQDLQIYREFSNKISRDVRDSRRNYENMLKTKSPKAIYKYTRSKISSVVSTPSVRRNDGSVSTSAAETAETLADVFSSVFTQEPDTPLPEVKNDRVIPSITHFIFSEEVILKQLQQLPLNKAPGPDNISCAVLNKCAIALAKPLAHIMQFSFNHSKLPESWRMASVTAIFKKGDKLDANNYRPISLVSICAKIMERIIANDLVNFTLTNKIIPDTQHGFLPRRSTTTNLLSCLNSWTSSIDKGQSVDVFYLDFSKAFDRVPKRRLLHKLEHFGIRGLLLAWIADFLSNRTFSVRIGDSHSNIRPVSSGVPQGSVLGPILYLIYTSDLPFHLKSSHAFYADDSKLFGNPLTDSKTLQADLLELETWCSNWLIPLNPTKCTVLHIGRNNPKITYYLGGTPVKSVESQSDLGIIVNSDLSWSEHIGSIVRKANFSCFILRKSFQQPDPQLFMSLYRSYVRPLLEYNGVIWSPHLIRDIALLEGVQRRFTKWVHNYKYLQYNERLDNLKLSCLSERRIRGDLIQCYRILKNTFTVNLSELFNLNVDNRLRGHFLKLVRENFKTSTRQHFLTNRVFHRWNSLPDSVVNATSINSFKNRYDEFTRSRLM